LESVGKFGERHFALAFPKNSDLKEIISVQIMKYIQASQILFWQSQYFIRIIHDRMERLRACTKSGSRKMKAAKMNSQMDSKGSLMSPLYGLQSIIYVSYPKFFICEIVSQVALYF